MVAAKHDHSKHMDIDFVRREAERVAPMDEEQMIADISKLKESIKILIEKREHVIGKQGEEKGLRTWK
jgi:hypothetical protein